jgi:DNA-binding response OmpR family regulator
MKVLYVAGTGAPGDGAAIRELTALEPSLDIRPVEGASAALGEIRSDDQYQAVFLSPELPHNEALALIASLRRDRVPVAVVALVTTEHRHFFAQALTGGADDVLTLGDTGLVSVDDTLRRIRHSRHVEPGEHSRLRLLYAGHDEVAWNVLCELPFAHTEQTTCAADGSCSLLMSDQGDEGFQCDALVVDENPGDAHALQVVKWVKSRHPDLPVIVLTTPTAGDVGGAALELGADDVVGKAGTYRRRLVATVYRLFFRRVLSRAAESAETVRAVTPAPFREPQLAEVAGGLSWPDERAALAPWGAEAPQGLDPAERDRLTDALRLAESRIDQLAEEAASARNALDALRAQHSREVEALQIERALRDRERAAEFASLSDPGNAADAERVRWPAPCVRRGAH